MTQELNLLQRIRNSNRQHQRRGSDGSDLATDAALCLAKAVDPHRDYHRDRHRDYQVIPWLQVVVVCEEGKVSANPKE